MNDSIFKLLIAFIVGVVVITIGMALANIAIVTLGGLLSGVSAIIMLLAAWADR